MPNDLLILKDSRVLLFPDGKNILSQISVSYSQKLDMLKWEVINKENEKTYNVEVPVFSFKKDFNLIRNLTEYSKNLSSRIYVKDDTLKFKGLESIYYI